MDLERYKGVFAAAPTPFFADGTVDVETAGEMVDFYVEGGLFRYICAFQYRRIFCDAAGGERTYG